MADAKRTAAVLAADGAIRTLLGSCRWVDVRADVFRNLIAAGQPVIFALWHGHLLPLSYRFRNHGLVPIISKSADGDAIAQLMVRWGYAPVRGSTSRGGTEALRQMIRLAPTSK